MDPALMLCKLPQALDQLLERVMDKMTDFNLHDQGGT